MKLLIVRHAIAMEREDYQKTARLASAVVTDPPAASTKDDEFRPLTLEGIRKMRKNAKGLKRLVPQPELLISSPLTRATQTAEILQETWIGLDCLQANELKPGTHPDALIDWFHQHPEFAKKKSFVAVVGHEPHLSHLVSWFLSGANRALLSLKKGGACLIEFDGAPRKGKGQLKFLVSGKCLPTS